MELEKQRCGCLYYTETMQNKREKKNQNQEMWFPKIVNSVEFFRK